MKRNWITLLELYPDYSGLFSLMGELPWSGSNLMTNENLDLDFFSKYGDFYVGNIISRFVDDNGTLPEDKKQYIADLIKRKFLIQWKHLYSVLESEYKPIENYSLVENRLEKVDEKVIDNGTISETGTTTNNQETRTDEEIKQTVVGKESTDHDANTSGTEHVENDKQTSTEHENSVYGFDSTSAAPKDEFLDNVSESGLSDTISETELIETSETNSNVTTSGTDNLVSKVNGSLDNEQNVTSESNKDVDRQTEHELTRSGNIGVTTSQQMLESEIALWQWNLFDNIEEMVSKLLTLPIH